MLSARAVLQQSKNSHMRQIEQMESEELLAQKKLRTEVIQLEDMLAQVIIDTFEDRGCTASGLAGQGVKDIFEDRVH